ncbi:MAG: phosphodiester glycosidase family protein [Gaiellaceae bacterium]
MPRKTLLTVLAAAVLTAPAHAAEPAVLMPGVTYERQLLFGRSGPKVVHVVTAPRPGGLYSLRPVLSNNAVVGKETVTAMQRRLAPAATVVSVNGDLSNAEGAPEGVLIQGGVLAARPHAKRSSLGIDVAGTLRVDRVALFATWQGAGQRRPLVGLNRRPGAQSVALYTPAWGAATPAEPGSAEVVLAGLGSIVAAGEHTAIATEGRSGGGTPVPPGGAVLVGRGAQGVKVTEEAQPGDSVTVRLVVDPDWRAVVDGMGGGPALVHGGKAIFNAREEFTQRLLSLPSARTAVGQRADGRVLLVAVDGALPGFSVGMTTFELAQTMVRLGAVTAIALEGGRAATLAFDGTLLNRTAGRERPVSESLALLYAGVYAPPLAPLVLSPNGDGIDERQTFRYRVVRPSSVSVSLVDPLGAGRVLETGERPPGIYALPWSGRKADGTLEPQGRWRWVVAAKDDLGRQSVAERLFSLNATLANVHVQPAVVRVGRRGGTASVSFTLTAGASWTGTIETPGGVNLRTYGRRTAGPGTVTFAWDGLLRGGAPAYGGRYLARVVARNDFGSATLARVFVVRRNR